MAGNQPAAMLFVEHPAVGQGKGLPQGGRLFRSGKAKGHDDRHMAGMFVVLPENFPDLLQDPRGIFQVALGQQHGEFVTAQPGHGVRGAQRAPQQAGGRLQHAVAGIMPQVVVDQLQTVDVAADDADHLVRLHVQPVQLVMEIDQAVDVRQGIIFDHLGQAVTFPLGGGDVRMQADEACGAAVGVAPQDTGTAQDPAIAAVRLEHAEGLFVTVPVTGRHDDVHLPLQDRRALIGMQLVPPAFEGVAEPALVIAQHGAIAGAVIDGVGLHVPVPQAVTAAEQGHERDLAAFAGKGLQRLVPAPLHEVPRHKDGLSGIITAHKSAADQEIFTAAIRQMQQHALHEAAVTVMGAHELGKTAGKEACRIGPHHVPDGLPGQTQDAAVGKTEQPGAGTVQRVFFPDTIIDPPAFPAGLMQPAPAVHTGQGPHQKAGRTAGETLQYDGTAADDVLAHGLQDLHGTVGGGAAQPAEKLPHTFPPAIGKTVTESLVLALVAFAHPALQQARGLRVQDDTVTVDVPLPKGICGIQDMGFIPIC